MIKCSHLVANGEKIIVGINPSVFLLASLVECHHAKVDELLECLNEAKFCVWFCF